MASGPHTAARRARAAPPGGAWRHCIRMEAASCLQQRELWAPHSDFGAVSPIALQCRSLEISRSQMNLIPPAGHDAQVYFGEDRSLQQQRVEATLRRAQRAIGTVHPQLDARQLRREGVLAIGWQRLRRD